VYGLCLRSERTIPGLWPAPVDTPVDVHATFTGSQPRQPDPSPEARLYASPGRDERGEPVLRVWVLGDGERMSYRLRWAYGGHHAEFDIVDGASRVRAAWSDGLPFEDVVSILIGPVLGCLLRARGLTGLHASATACRGGAILVIGPKGGGKSTVAAHLCAQGFPVLTDDIAVLKESEGRPMVQPGYPRMRQWPSTLSALPDLDPEALPRVVSLADKRYVELAPRGDGSRWQFCPEPLPLSGIYLLDAPGPAGTTPHIDAMQPSDGLIALVRNTYADYMLDREGRARDFTLLGRVAKDTPLRLVCRPLGLDSVPRVCQAILKDARALKLE
jgi:hypothetical protein